MGTKIAIIISFLFAVSCVKPGDKAPKPDYVITSGAVAGFTATRKSTTGEVIGTVNLPIQDVIDSIKADAAGKDCVIQFGDGKNVLDLGNGTMTFDGGTSGTDWGEITLLGKVISEIYYQEEGVLCLRRGVYVNSLADIANTADVKGAAICINNLYTGTINRMLGVTLNIVSGTVETVSGFGIYYYSPSHLLMGSTINIKGGMVRATGDNGTAIYCNMSRVENSTIINISGGTVSAKGYKSIALYSYSYLSGYIENINISGGEIIAEGAECIAIYNNRNIPLNIDGGTISAIGFKSTALYNVLGESVTINGGSILATGYLSTALWNERGILNINGGKIKATGHDDCWAIYSSFETYIRVTLSGSHDITGLIDVRDFGGIGLAGGFMPQEKAYILSSYSAYDDRIVVTNGAEYISNFTIGGARAELYTLAINGNGDIVFKSKSENVAPSEKDERQMRFREERQVTIRESLQLEEIFE
jgi:hypothetical protein